MRDAIATIIPPFAIISVISVCYSAFRSNAIVSRMLEGMQAGVGAVIAAVVFEMAEGIIHGKNRISILIMALSFIAACILGVNVICIVLACGAFGAVRTLVKKRREGRA